MSLASLASPLTRLLRPRASPPLLVNPAYAAVLNEAGLVRAEDCLRLPETIVSGHPGRQVSRVLLGSGPQALAAFLKREHWVPWKERLLNARDGFGLVSKSLREARTLEALRPHFAGCPDWIAAGELPDGQAFLLVPELPGRLELRRFLQSRGTSLSWRRRFAHKLGRLLASLHESGFTHGDLYANHVLVDPETEAIELVDWQRGSRQGRPALSSRWRDLATLAATLPGELVAARERLACLSAYLDRARLRPLFREAVSSVRRIEADLSRRRHVRAKRLLPLAPGQQSLVCLDEGNALCATPGFLALWPASIPDFLRTAPEGATMQREVELPDGGRGLLVRGRYVLPWYCRRDERRLWTSPERLRMSLLFRLQRFGIEAPQVLAVGERPSGDEQIDAFLLTRQPPATQSLTDWLVERAGRLLRPEERRLRWDVLRQAGALLARLHEAGCYFRGVPWGLAVQTLVASKASASGGVYPRRDKPGGSLGFGTPGAESLRLVVDDATGLCIRRHFRHQHARRDWAGLCRQLLLCGGSRTDARRVLHGYKGIPETS
jgi:tRNA A-37 threonylcarbamoyl transferase component Bud32